ISGGAGSGKTTIASAIANFVSDEALLALHVEWISCKYDIFLCWTRLLSFCFCIARDADFEICLLCRLLLGRPMQEVLTVFKRAYARANTKAPSLVVLDDLDQLMPAFEEDAGHGNAQADMLSTELVRLLAEQKQRVQ